MGKKSKLKKIRRIASQLPVIKTYRVKGERMKGEELMTHGVKEVEEKPVDANAIYKKKTVIEVPLNHNRKMKQLYNQYGAAGVNGYIQAVQRHATAEKYKQ